MSVPKIWHTSSSRHQSLSVRDSRDTSRLPTMPTSPSATKLRTRSKPSRWAEARPALDPRSLLTISTCFQPSARTRSATAYLEELTFLILSHLFFLILSHLFFAGLPKVDNRLASQVLRFDFGIVQDLCHWLFPPPRERPLPERGP